MLYISAYATYNYNQEFELAEIHISDGVTTQVMKKSYNYIPQEYPFNLHHLIEASKSTTYPLGGFSKIRTINDKDPSALAKFWQQKLTNVDIRDAVSEKKLYEVITSFGEPYGQRNS